MGPDCIFCQIASHQSPANIRFENERVIAFDDINKDAPVHIQIIPKEHLSSLNVVTTEHAPLLGELLVTAAKIAKEQGIDQAGYRCVMNTGKHGGQIIQHLHLHLLGGRMLGPSTGSK